MTDTTKIIKGAGGGGSGGSKAPYRAPDTLHSRQFATIQDLVSEGEIEGFASASKEGLTKGTTAYDNASLKDVFLNDTPILQSSATSASPAASDFNFQDVTFKSKFGTSNQTAMSGIPTEVRTPTVVNVTPVNTDGTESQGIAGAVTRQITRTDVSAVIVTLTWPALQRFEDDGDIVGELVAYKIEVQHDSGGFVNKLETSVKGRSADSYSRDHRIELTAGYTTVDIRVIRIDQDSTESTLINAFQWTSFQEVIDTNSTYPDSAYVALRMDSKQFNSIPTRKYRLRGIKVRIPGAGASSSGTPTVDIQTGRIQYPTGYIFNGVMGAAVYTNCPAMILLDLLINKRYGLGNHIASDQSSDTTTYSNVDLFSFVAASKYSNEEVDDGTGAGTKEARFSCNVNIQSPKEAFAAINDLSGVMRCMPIWSAGAISISQDKPTTASYLFNLANVGQSGFSYSGSSLKTRNSVISVSYFNMDSREVDFEVVEADQATQNKLGIITKTIKAFACTSRNQAARLGRAVLFAEQNESETVTFSTSIDSGIVVRPGSVIEVNDPVRAGARRGGRVVSATTTTITIDAEAQTTLPSLTDSPTISVILSDGTVEVGTISAISGAVITVNSVTKVNDQDETVTQSTFSSAPLTNAPYLISSTNLQTQLFRVIQVEEQDDINYVITALSYVEGKYAFIEDNTPLPERKVSILNDPVNPPSNLQIEERNIVINGMARSKLFISWKEPTTQVTGLDASGNSVVIEKPQGVSQYQLSYRYDAGTSSPTNFVTQIVHATDFEILDTKAGFYDIEIFSFNSSLQLSTSALTDRIQTEGKTGVPENVSDLTIEPVNEQFVRLRFKRSVAVDVLHGGRVYVRHTRLTGGSATFQAAQDIIQAVAGNANEVICPALQGTYLLKFQDDTGNFSADAATVGLSEVDFLDSIIVKTDREDTDGTPYNGTKSNVVYDGSLGGLKLTDPTANTTGTYDFVDTLDLGSTFSLVLKRHFQGVGFYTGDQFDNRTANIDTWTDFDGTVANDANAKIAVRTTTDNPSSSPTYGSFNDFANGTFKGRGFQFRITLDTTDAAQNMNLQQAGYTATMPSRTETSSVIASGSGAKAVTFTSPFFVGTSGLGNLNNFLPAINIAPQNMATGDYFELSSISGTGFTVHFKNSSNASIDRNFTYSAVGFGKGG